MNINEMENKTIGVRENSFRDNKKKIFVSYMA